MGKLRRYLGGNWGAPFIFGFILLLLTCAGLMVSNRLALADEIAVYAYYMLVIGVLLQIVSFLRRRGSVDETENTQNDSPWS